MRTLESGFGGCSLRTSTFICLGVIVVFNVLGILSILGGYSDTGIIGGTVSIIVCASLIAVLGYTIYKLHLEDPSMLNVAFIALAVYVVLSILGIIVTIFSHLFSLTFYLGTLPYLAFLIYSTWIVYSYSIEFRTPVSIHA